MKVIGRIEQAVLRGGLLSMAMPRGSGKTTICECACIWAALNGHREFVCLIGSDEGHAMDMLESIKMELDERTGRVDRIGSKVERASFRFETQTCYRSQLLLNGRVGWSATSRVSSVRLNWADKRFTSSPPIWNTAAKTLESRQ